MPNQQYLHQAKKVSMYYDPRGQVVRTVNPDNSQQWVLFGRPTVFDQVSLNELELPTLDNHPDSGLTPWESCTFDANDLADRPPFSGSGAPSTHWNTPKTTILDALGRTVKTIDRLAGGAEVVMRYEYDIRGNLLKVTDALNRTAFTHVYDLKPKSGEGEDEQGANILKTTHIDSGNKTALFDASFKPTELKDAKGAQILHGYDQLSRPTRIWAKDNAGEDVTLRQKLVYGDDAVDGPTTPTDTNHLGQLYEHYDEAGLVTLEAYDFKGNVLRKAREVISDAEILSVFDGPPADWEVPTYRVDWEGTPDLEGEYATDMEYDALNRVTKLTYPEDVDAERKELVPVYNRAGALEKVSLDGNPYVEHMAYNAKGQRLLIAFGNDVMTRYAYNSETFRLTRQRSETYTRSGHTYTPNGTVHQDTGYDYDLSGNILMIKERVNNCGVGGSNSLDRVFNYDPLYRLHSATGRENSPTITPIWDDSYRSTDHSITTAYTQNYQYDSMGNIQQLKHTGNNNFTRNFNYSSTHNKLQGITIGGDTYSFTYDANGNQIQENTDRHFEWDASDKLRSFRVQVGASQPTRFAHYLYDAGGNRVKKLVRVSGGNYTSTTYIDGVFEKLTDGTDIQNTLHVMDDTSRIATVRMGTAFGDATPEMKYVLEDHLGNSTFEVNGDGTFIAKEEYYPFGETSFASYGKKRYKYNGKERDEESGLYNYGMRCYSSWTCRFISVDPIKHQYPELTPFQYASNRPINLIDLDGLEGAQRVNHEERTTTLVLDVYYVPVDPDNPEKETSGFTEKQVEMYKESIDSYFEMANELSLSNTGQPFIDKNHRDENGNPYTIKLEVNFVAKQSMDEIFTILNKDGVDNHSAILYYERSAQLQGGGHMSASPHVLNLSGITRIAIGTGHAALHEIFHLFITEHPNTTDYFRTIIDPNSQREGHDKLGGIFSHDIKFLNQQNIDDALQILPETINPVSPSTEKQ